MTPNFSDDELKCPCGCGMLPNKSFMAFVQVIRDRVGFAMPVSSAARCPEYNAKVSKTGLTGPHTTGKAIDILVSGPKAYKIIQTALLFGMWGIGVSQKGPHESRFIHLDMVEPSDKSPRPTIWSY